jgi:hypothetical protein
VLVLVIYRKFHALDDGTLAFCADLLRALKGNQGELKVMRCLLKDGFSMGLGLVRDTPSSSSNRASPVHFEAKITS